VPVGQDDPTRTRSHVQVVATYPATRSGP